MINQYRVSRRLLTAADRPPLPVRSPDRRPGKARRFPARDELRTGTNVVPDQRRSGTVALDRAAAFLRTDPARWEWAARSHDHVAEALADLDALGNDPAVLDGAVRILIYHRARSPQPGSVHGDQRHGPVGGGKAKREGRLADRVPSTANTWRRAGSRAAR
jgi:hypothetical protein